MTIVPIINVQNALELEQKIRIAQSIYQAHPESEPWVQIDVADGSFTKGYANWREPKDLNSFPEVKSLNIEIDALLLDPKQELLKWAPHGIKRFIFYLETIQDPQEILDLCLQSGIEPVLASTPQTSAEQMAQYLQNFKSCQLLAVNPGLSGQEFNPQTLEKIQSLHKNFPNLNIEIDGGVNLEVARQCKDAGATCVASSSFLMDSSDPVQTFSDLMAIG